MSGEWKPDDQLTETERLKQNTEKSKVVQTLDAVGKYIHEISESCDHRLRWSLRCDVLEGIALLGYWVILTTALFMNAPDDVRRICTDLALGVVLVAMFRSWKATKLWREKEGEWVGATKMLQLFGMLPPDKERGIKNKKKLWSEGMEMVKRWAAEKAAQLKKGFAPA